MKFRALCLVWVIAITSCGVFAQLRVGRVRSTATRDTAEAPVAVASEHCPVQAELCTNAADDACLEPLVHEGQRVVRYRNRELWTDGRMPGPHFLVEHMRAVRNAYEAASPGATRDLCRSELVAQVDYLRGTLTARGDALVWENQEGIAQAMEQAEHAHLFASIAVVLEAQGQLDDARSITSTALALGRALDRTVGVRSGGVRSEPQPCTDGQTPSRQCFWLHSRGLGVSEGGGGPRVVLNQHLHAIADTLLLYQLIDEHPAILDPAEGERGAILAAILDRAIGALYQLAFGPGFQRPAGNRPARPPNLAQMVERVETNGAAPFMWVSYEFDLNEGRPRNISFRNTCHYHGHTLQVLANIVAWVDAHRTIGGDAGRRLAIAIDHLLAPDGPVRAIVESESNPSIRNGARGCSGESSLRDVAVFRARFGPD
jgi:hypothetical protein